MHITSFQQRNALSIGFLAAGLWMFAPERSLAQEIPAGKSFSASLRENFSYSTNPLMVTDGASSLWGSVTSPQLTYRSATPISQLMLNGRVDQNLFNQAEFNTTDFHGNGSISRKSERWQLSMKANADYDSTRTSELTSYSLRPVVSRHLGVSGTPTLSYSPTQTDMISLSGAGSMSQYQRSDYTNYVNYSITPSYSHRFDPLNTGIFSVQARRYRATRGSGSKVDSISPTFGWERIFSQRLKANFSFGGQISREFNYGHPVNAWKPTYVFSGGLSFQGQQDHISLSASRSQSSYANGSDGLQTAVSLANEHAINPRLSLNGGVGYQMVEYQRASTGDLESLADGHGGISYHLTKAWDVTADYRYRYETLTNRTKTAQDSTFMIGVAFHPEAWALAD